MPPTSCRPAPLCACPRECVISLGAKAKRSSRFMVSVPFRLTTSTPRTTHERNNRRTVKPAGPSASPRDTPRLVDLSLLRIRQHQQSLRRWSNEPAELGASFARISPTLCGRPDLRAKRETNIVLSAVAASPDPERAVATDKP